MNLKTSLSHLPPYLTSGKIYGMNFFTGARKQLAVIVLIGLFLLLMMNLNSRLAEYLQFSQQRDQAATKVSNLVATSTALETQVAYATSDQAVEDWARNEAHMAKTDDKIILPMVVENRTPTPAPIKSTTTRPIENWEAWWALFFGE